MMPCTKASLPNAISGAVSNQSPDRSCEILRICALSVAWLLFKFHIRGV